MFKCFKKCCKKKEVNRQKQVYVLRLNNGKYYVGESDDVPRRVWIHENGSGSAWTKKYNMIEQIEPITKLQPFFSELLETLEMMNLYGIDNVRGSMFTNPFILSPYEKVVAAQLYCELKGYCRKCGYSGHYISSCNSKTTLK